MVGGGGGGGGGKAKNFPNTNMVNRESCYTQATAKNVNKLSDIYVRSY